jgi:hypothetical protein
MHSVGLNTHGNPHLTTRGLQQPEPTTPVNPIPSSDDGEEDGSFGAAVNVTLSANAKAHMGLTLPEDGKGNRANSTAHQARSMVLPAGMDAGGGPFGKIVSEIARFGLEAATALFNPTPTPVNPPAPPEPVDAEEGVEGDEGGEGTVDTALASQPVPPLEDLLLEEDLLAPLVGSGETDLIDELLDPDADDPEPEPEPITA